MKKTWKNFLISLLLLPVLPIFGVGAGDGEGGDDKGADGQDKSGSGDSKDGDKGKDSGDQGGDKGDKGQGQKTFTEDEVNKIVQERLKRDREKRAKEGNQGNQGQQNQGNQQNNQGQQGDQNNQGNQNQQGSQNNQQNQQGQQDADTQYKLEVANVRLIEATATIEATKLSVDPKYVSEVVKLADLSKIEVKEDGTVDAGAVSKALDDVLKRIPVFKVQQDSQQAGGFRVGGEGQQQQQSNNGWSQNQGQQTKRWNRNR